MNESLSSTVFKYFYCTNCESLMWVPNEKRFGMKAAFIFGSLFALILGGVYLDNDPGVEFYFACLIPAVLFLVSFCFYLKYSR